MADLNWTITVMKIVWVEDSSFDVDSAVAFTLMEYVPVVVELVVEMVMLNEAVPPAVNVWVVDVGLMVGGVPEGPRIIELTVTGPAKL